MTNTELEETNPTVEKNEKLYDQITKRFEPLTSIKFAAYRVACKLRVIQKYLKLTYVDYNILVRVFNTHDLQFGIEKSTISYEDAKKVLVGIYQLISSYHFNEATMDEIIETLLRFFCDILQIQINEEFDLNSFKILLFALSNAKLPEKYRCFFRQITSPNVIASQTRLTELFEILLKVPNHFDNVDSFHPDNIPSCVQSCLDHTHDGIVREDLFVNWMSREPQTLVWLPTLHRLIATETVRHEARCDTCKAYPVIGMRYRCLRCFNYDLCQTCFFTGDHAKKHDGSHPIEEYCKQVTPFEDLKAFMEFLKLKVGKKELRRKERYLTIERSKSFSETPVNSSEDSSSQLLTNGHQSLTHQEQSDTKALLQDIYRSVPKCETSGKTQSHSTHEPILPMTGYDNVPHPPPEKKKIEIPIKKFLTKDDSLIENYVNLEQKKNSSSSSSKRTQISDDDDEAAPMLMPKQHNPSKKSLFNKPNTSEHYQLPGKTNTTDMDDEYQPPLPPKQRQNTSRAMVYDFIGSELQELRVALAQFDGTAKV